jgi:hypothetical protein
LATKEEKITATNSEISYNPAKADCFFNPAFSNAFSALLFWLLFRPLFFGPKKISLAYLPTFSVLKIDLAFSSPKNRHYFFTEKSSFLQLQICPLP